MFRVTPKWVQLPRFIKQRYQRATMHTWGDSSSSPDSSAQPLLHKSRLRPALIRSERHGELRYGHTMCQLCTQLEPFHSMSPHCLINATLHSLNDGHTKHNGSNFRMNSPLVICRLKCCLTRCFVHSPSTSRHVFTGPNNRHMY